MTAPDAHPRRSGARQPARPLATLGPAFVAAIAYVDPGNFATNVLAGAEFGYALVWVVIAANLMAMLVQSLSAKLGLATGRNLAELCRERFPRRVTLGLFDHHHSEWLAPADRHQQRRRTGEQRSLRVPADLADVPHPDAVDTRLDALPK